MAMLIIVVITLELTFSPVKMCVPYLTWPKVPLPNGLPRVRRAKVRYTDFRETRGPAKIYFLQRKIKCDETSVLALSKMSILAKRQ